MLHMWRDSTNDCPMKCTAHNGIRAAASTPSGPLDPKYISLYPKWATIAYIVASSERSSAVCLWRIPLL